jgi:hypothetical protein
MMRENQGQVQPPSGPQGKVPQEEGMLGMKKVQPQLGKGRLHPRREGERQGVLMVSRSPKGGKSKNPFFPLDMAGILGCKDKHLVTLCFEFPAEDLDGGGEAIDQGLVIAGKDADLHGRDRPRRRTNIPSFAFFTPALI